MVYLLVKTACTNAVWLNVVGRGLLRGVTRVHSLSERLCHVTPRASLKSMVIEVAHLQILLDVLLPLGRGENGRRLVTIKVVDKESLLSLRGKHRAGCID